MEVLERPHAGGAAQSGSAIRPMVAHVVPEYLPRSATFIHTLLTHQTRFRPVVLARAITHLDEFPTETAIALTPAAGWAAREAGRLRALGAGYGTVYEHRIARACADAACVLVHAHFGWSGRDSARAARRLRRPLVTTFYGRDLSERSRASRRDPYRRLFSEGALFVVEGPAMSDHLARIGCPPSRIRIVPIGIELEQLPFVSRGVGSPVIVVQTGRFVEKKGIDLSIRAFAAARHEIGPSELWLVGDGPLRADLEKLASELGVQDDVRFAGMVSHARYRELVARADVCLQPSRTAADGDTEGGAPTVILEMQAMGVRVVATRHADIPFVSAHPDELTPEENVEALAGALVRAATEPEDGRRSRLVEARAFVEERHDAWVTARDMEAVYDEALS